MLDILTAESGPTPISVRIRPTWLILAARAALAVVSFVLAVVGWHLDLRSLPWPLFVFAFTGAYGVVRAALGRVILAPAGIEVRALLRVRRIAWSEILGIDLDEHFGGRSVKVHAGIKTLDLPVPRTSRLIPDQRFTRDFEHLRRTWLQRTGKFVPDPEVTRSRRRLILLLSLVMILALFSAPDRPWGWAGGPMIATIPHACDVLSDDIIARLEATHPRTITAQVVDARAVTNPDSSECSWTLPNQGKLFVAYQLFRRHGLHSAQNEAEHDQAIGNRETGKISNLVPAASALSAAHDIPGRLLIGPVEQGWFHTYSTGARQANVEVAVAAGGAVSLDEFALVANAAFGALAVG